MEMRGNLLDPFLQKLSAETKDAEKKCLVVFRGPSFTADKRECIKLPEFAMEPGVKQSRAAQKREEATDASVSCHH